MGFVHLISKKSYALCLIGFLLSVASLFLSYFTHDVFYFILHQQMKLTEGSRALKLWSEPPVEQSLTFYVFNWTNPDEFGKERPNLVEMGPFKYNSVQKKINIAFNDNDTLSYNVQRYWYFDEEESNFTDTTHVTTLNAILYSAAHALRYAGFLRQRAFAVAASAYKLDRYLTKPVRQLIFEGVSDPLLSTASYFQSFTSIDVPFDKFAWFYDRNGTSYLEGTYNVGTGRRNLNDVTMIHKWDWGSRTPYFEGECGLVNGSTGELFHPGLTKNDVLEFFLPDFCRSIKLYFKSEAEVHGVRGYKFVADARAVDNGTIDAANRCFCAGECSPVGVLNATTCRYGTPAFISFPHFLHADPSYMNNVVGLKPDADKHEFYVIVEPNTGVTLDVTMRLQGNVLTTPHKYLSVLADAPKMYFPTVWSEARAVIPRYLAAELQLGLLFFNYGSIGFLVLAFLCLIPVIVILARARSKSLAAETKSNIPAFLEQPLLTQKT